MCRKPFSRIYRPLGAGMIAPMTLVRIRANEVGSPALRQPWLAVLLRAFVELVRNVVATL